jgi:subtilisin family serine protease
MADNIIRHHFRINTKLVYEVDVEVTGRSTMYIRSDYSEHGKFLLHKSQELSNIEERKSDYDISSDLYLEIRVPEKYNIRNEKTKLEQAGIDLISYSLKNSNVGFGRIGKKRYEIFQQRLALYGNDRNNPGRSYFSIIDDINPVPIGEKISEEISPSKNRQSYILLFYSDIKPSTLPVLKERLVTVLEPLGVQLKNYHTLSTGDTTASIYATYDELKEIGEKFTSVRKIILDRIYFLTDSSPIGSIPDNIALTQPSHKYAVAVIDTGIDPRSLLLNPLVISSISKLPTGAVRPIYDHGTFVASRIAFDDDIERGLQSGRMTARCKLIDIPIFGVDNSGNPVECDEQHLAKVLDDIVNILPPEAKVINISLGSNVSILDYQYSLAAITIDKLSREKNILFVLSAGNIRDPRLVATYPLNILHPSWRIDPPAESLLAISVGAIAKYDGHDTLSRINELSPFSRIGPGADGGMKPELVAHGGNCHNDGKTSSRIAAQGIGRDGKTYSYDYGTSFSAPLISGIACELMSHYPNSGINLIKALLFHFAEEAIAPRNATNKYHCVGFGSPNFKNTIDAKRYSGTYLHEGILRKNKKYHIPFYVPSIFESGISSSHLRIKGTVIFDPPVDSANLKEYSCAKLSFQLRKKQPVGYTDVNLSGDYVFHQQWNPIIQFSKSFHRSFASGKWELITRLWTRGPYGDFIQKFAVVIEIIDETNNNDVWQTILIESGTTFLSEQSHVA